MKSLPVPRLVVIAAAAVVLAVLPFQLSGYHQGIASRVAIYFIAILGLNILTGYTGQISIGHGAFMAIGGYTTAIMSHDHHTNLIATPQSEPRPATAAPIRIFSESSTPNSFGCA